MTQFIDKFGDINSVVPPTKYLTFGPWIYLVPQYIPKDVLMLGYAGGTTSGLIRLLYGDIPIVAVDIEPCTPLYGEEMVRADAKEYVKTCKHFDTVIVDVFPSELREEICDFVLTKEFAVDVSRIANYIIVNTLKNPDMSNWGFLKRVGMNKPSRCDNRIYY